MRIAIIGNGIAGVTAARKIRELSDHEIHLISSEHPSFFSRTALMYLYMGHMRMKDITPFPDSYWQKNDIKRIYDQVLSVDFDRKMLPLAKDEALSYDRLILATGSSYNTFGWHGLDLDGVRGLYHLHDLEYLEERSARIKQAVIIGGGLIGIELAEMFLGRQIAVTFLVRENSFWDIVLPAEESAMINRHIREHGINLRLNTQLKRIIGNDQGQVIGVETDTGETIDCQYVGITAGVHPNVHFLRETTLEIDRGILVDRHLQTNIPGVYAVGDCAEMRDPLPGRRPVEPLWYTGRMMGECVAKNICGEQVSYDPGIWFNSAKFLDIEYQVYGNVPNEPSDAISSLYWEHPNGKKSIRINYYTKTGKVAGFNLMGIRYRHQVCEKWISEGADIEDVLRHLTLANFDPEFYPQYESHLIRSYQDLSGKKLKSNGTRSWDLAFDFLRKKAGQ